MAERIVKIFGERNTGTRAMLELLKQVPGVRFRVGPKPDLSSYDTAVQAAVETQMTGRWRRSYLHAIRDEQALHMAGDDPWKHAAPTLTPAMRESGVAAIHMVRDPYSWLVALARRPYHIKGPNAETLEDFAARPWMTERREGLPAVVLSPVTLWAMKAEAIQRYRVEAAEAGLPCAIVRFEDFVQEPVSAAARAFAEIGLLAPPLKGREDNTKSGEAPLDVLRAYYREERWASWLTTETVTRVNAQIDWAVASEFGYARRDAAAYPSTLPEEIRRQMAAEMASLSEPSHRETGATPAT